MTTVVIVALANLAFGLAVAVDYYRSETARWKAGYLAEKQDRIRKQVLVVRAERAQHEQRAEADKLRELVAHKEADCAASKKRIKAECVDADLIREAEQQGVTLGVTSMGQCRVIPELYWDSILRRAGLERKRA